MLQLNGGKDMISYIMSFMRNKNFLIRIVSSYVLVGLLVIGS